MFRIYLLILSIYGIKTQFPNLSISRQYGEHYCMLTNDSSGLAIVWDIENNEKKDITYGTIDERQTRYSMCSIKYDKSKITWIDTYDTGASPILDYRWESFQSVQLERHPVNVYKAKGVNEDIQISFSFKIKEVQIFLCDQDILHEHQFGNCYWLGLGTYNGTKLYIRKCARGDIPLNINDYAIKQDCRSFQTEHYNPSLLKNNEWNHITVRKKGNNILAWKYNNSTPFFNYTDNYDYIKTQYVYVRTPSNETRHMKIHKLKVLSFSHLAKLELTFINRLETNCIAFYVKVCDGCVLELSLYNDEQQIAFQKTEVMAKYTETLVKS